MTICEIKVDTLSGQQKHVIVERDDGSVMSFPADIGNPHYQNIMQLVAEGKLTIAPAK